MNRSLMSEVGQSLSLLALFVGTVAVSCGLGILAVRLG
jgi:hypothetical protein